MSGNGSEDSNSGKGYGDVRKKERDYGQMDRLDNERRFLGTGGNVDNCPEPEDDGYEDDYERGKGKGKGGMGKGGGDSSDGGKSGGGKGRNMGMRGGGKGKGEGEDNSNDESDSEGKGKGTSSLMKKTRSSESNNMEISRSSKDTRAR